MLNRRCWLNNGTPIYADTLKYFRKYDIISIKASHNSVYSMICILFKIYMHIIIQSYKYEYYKIIDTTIYHFFVFSVFSHYLKKNSNVKKAIVPPRPKNFNSEDTHSQIY